MQRGAQFEDGPYQILVILRNRVIKSYIILKFAVFLSCGCAYGDSGSSF